MWSCKKQKFIGEPQTERVREMVNKLVLSIKKKTLCEREFELHFIFCVPDWWPMRWMMFCSAVWYCLILTTQKERTLIISGLCIEKGAGVVRMLKRVQEGGRWWWGRSDKPWWRWANDSRGRWREPSPMTTQPEPASWSQRGMDTQRGRGKQRMEAKRERKSEKGLGVFGCTCFNPWVCALCMSLIFWWDTGFVLAF